MDFTLLVGSCDKYEYLWEQFGSLFNKYWDNSIKVDKYIITQSKNADVHGFKTIKVKDPMYTTGLKRAIEKTKPKNILWFQDDYFLRTYLLEEQMKDYYDFFISNNAGRFGIHDDSTFYSKLPVYKNIYKFHQQSLYTISLQASFWNVDFLYDCFDKDKEETPWEFEVDGSRRINGSIMHRIFFAAQEKPWYLEACRKGEFTSAYYEICKQEKMKEIKR